MKYSKLTRAIVAVITSTMLLSMVACGGTSNSSTTTDSGQATTTAVSTGAEKTIEPLGKYGPEITVTTIKGLSDTLQKAVGKKSDVVQDNIWNRSYKTDLGINLNYMWTVPGSQFEQKLNISISANDLPDIIPANQRQLKLLVDSGNALDITQLFKDYASPFTMEMMQADNNIGLGQATFDGKLMALPQLNGNVDASSMLWIRADWLKSLNLQAPKTMADVLKISEEFTKNDPDKNGKSDTYGLGLEKGLVGGFADLNGMLECYHGYIEGWIKDSSGKLVFGGIQPEIKTGLAQLAEMYKDGQIDKEFSVKDGTKVAESLVAGKIGMVYGQHWIPFWPLQDAKNKDPKADWKPYPIVSIDDKPAQPMINGSATTFFVVNKNMKNPEAAVKLYNYYYAKDCALSKDFDPNFHGINGEMETKPDQNFEWAVINSFYPLQNLFIHRQVKQYLESKDEKILENFWIKDNVDQNQKYLAGDNKLWSAYGWSGSEGAFSVVDLYDTNKLFLQNAYIKADTDSMTQKGATLKQKRDEIFTKIIMGIAPISDFDVYVDQWHKLGGDDITNEVNAAK